MPAHAGALLRIEHAQVLRAEDIPRFAALGVIASMQPIHLVSDRPVAARYWRDRCARAYAWKSILDAGGTVAFGSDAPIESPDPLAGIHAAVARCDPANPGEGAWYPEGCLAVWQAVDCYTAGSAAASRAGLVAGREGRGQGSSGRDRGGQAAPYAEGTITPGARADLTILDRNIFAAADPRAILEARVVGTVGSGEARLNS